MDTPPPAGRRPVSLRGHGRLLAAALLLLALGPPARAHAPHDTAELLVFSPDFDTDGIALASCQLSEKPLLARTLDGGKSWQLYAPPMVLDAISQLAFSPDFTNDQTIFASTEEGGMWRSTDGGGSWEPIDVGLTDPACFDVAVSPDYANDRTLITATGSGVFRSDDGGDTWVSTTLFGLKLKSCAFGLGPDDRVVAFAADTTMHRSIDGGLTWSNITTWPFPVSSIALSADFTTDATLTVCFGRFGQGIQLSTDLGNAWAPMVTGLTDSFINRVRFASDGTLFAVGQTEALFRASSAGTAWTLFAGEGYEVLSDLTFNHYRDVAVSPTYATDGEVWVAGFEGIFVSEDQGQTVRQLDLYSQRALRGLVVSPQFAADRTLFTASYGGGILRYGPATGIGPAPGAVGPTLRPAGPGPGSSAGGPIAPLGPPGGGPGALSAGWTSRSQGIFSPYSAGLWISPSYATDRTLFYTYNGLWISQDAGLSWTPKDSPPGVVIVRTVGITPDWPGDQTLFIGTSLGDGTWRSTEGGDNWQELGGLPADHTTRWVLPTPTWGADGTAYLATKRKGIWKTTDRGDTWTEVSTGLPEDINLRVMAMSPDFTFDQTLFIGTRQGGLFRSTDAAASWVEVGGGLPESDVLSVEHLACSPDFAVDGTLWIATLSHGVWRSVDGGDTWAASSTSLATTSTRLVEPSPDFAQDSTVFCATQDGALLSTDGGVSWESLPGYTRLDDKKSFVAHDGFWLEETTAGVMAQTITRSDEAGAETFLTFNGTGAAWHAVKRPDGGIAEVFLDDQLVAGVDLYAPTSGESEVAWSVGELPQGPHRVVVRVTGSANAASSGAIVASDGFAYRYLHGPALD